MPIDLALVPAGECDPPSRFARKGDALFQLTNRHTGTIYWLSTGDTCGIYGPPAPFVAWGVGDVVEPSTLVQAQVTIDP
jgi:hypothetical protein